MCPVSYDGESLGFYPHLDRRVREAVVDSRPCPSHVLRTARSNRTAGPAMVVDIAPVSTTTLAVKVLHDEAHGNVGQSSTA